MAQYVLAHRRSGMFTDEAKIASRAAVQTTLRLLTGARVVADHTPADPLARRVVLLEAEARQVTALRAKFPADAILESVVRRYLHFRASAERRPALPHAATAKAAAANYRLTLTAGGEPLDRIDVDLHLRAPGGRVRVETVKTDARGTLAFRVPRGLRVAFVKPTPYAGFWSMWAKAPPCDSTIDCLAIAGAQAGGSAWWHDAMGIDVRDTARGGGIRVGVIDTGCGPHRNLAHVTLVGAFIDGRELPPRAARDVAHHGTHTTGIIGARPTEASDYGGMAAGCDLFHARAFKGTGPQDHATQGDIVNAIDSLSRTHRCDLINMSFGGPKSKAEEDAIQDAAERGTLCVCSAGNESGPIDFPAAYSQCAAVSAIGKVGWAPAGTFSASNRPRGASKMGRKNLFLATFSCFGRALTCAAPGVGIVSTVPDRGGVVGAYMEKDGTSQASPAACGVLAVILSRDTTYRTLPRDITRFKRAALTLSQHSKPIGLPARFEGRGLPTA